VFLLIFDKMAAQLKDIVEALNSPPFSLSLSLVSFDEKEPGELLELLRKVTFFYNLLSREVYLNTTYGPRSRPPVGLS
jgi:hypothetical protein